MSRLTRSLIRNLFDTDREETTGEVLFFRVFELFVVYGTVKLAWDWGLYIRRISDVVLPLGVAQYIDVSFMFDHGLALGNAALITALALVGFLRLWRGAYLVAFLLLHLQYASRFVLGEIPHSANMLGMTLLGLSLGALVFGEARKRRRFTMGFTYFSVGLGYTLAAFSKLIGTGLTWADGRHLWLWVGEKAVDTFAKTGVFDYNVVQEIVLSSHTTATLFLAIGWLTELFAFLFWWRSFRLPVGLAIIGLHIGIYYTMNIFFALAMYELILLTFPWAAWIDAALAHRTTGALVRPIAAIGTRYP